MAPSSSSLTTSTKSSAIQIMEECHISPSPSSNTTTLPPSLSLPLTFLDIPWLQFSPLQPLFFFQLAPAFASAPHNLYLEFSTTILPRLKQSLSSALQYFFPLAGKLVSAPPDNLVFLTVNKSSATSDSVALTVAQCDADFNALCSYLPTSAHLFHQLVPSLPTISPSTLTTTATTANALLAIQITFFPTSPPGFSIGIASHPVLCDQRTLSNFLYFWAALSKFGHLDLFHGNGKLPHYPATFDRSVIHDSAQLQPILLKQWLCLESTKTIPGATAAHGLLRSTFVMTPIDIANATRWIRAKCDKFNRSYPVVLSPYAVTCAFIWTCFLRARVQNSAVTKAKAKGLMYFGFIAGGITRVPFQVLGKYFGNCVGFGRAVASREELLKEDEGMLAAADAIALTIKTLDNDILGGAKKWISDWQKLIGSEDHIHVVGSPKVNLYETDFGWGKPKKIQEISIDQSRAISLTQSRDMKGGIEIGLSLPNSIMDAFSTLFTKGLHHFTL